MVTVIVLVYKNLSNLEKTIRSVLQQDYKDMELIISDDCSPEFDVVEYDKWIRSFDVCHENISIIIRKNEENLGIVKHYNRVIRMSSGKIIIPLSCGDVFFEKDTVTKICDFFSTNRCRVATAKRKCGDKILPTAQQIEVIKKGGKALIRSLCRGNYISGSCLYYDRTFFDQYGYFDERLFLVDDYPMLLRILFLGQAIPVMDEITISYEMSGVSNSKSPNPLFEKDMEKIFNLQIEPNRQSVGWETFRYLKCRNYVHTHTGGVRWLHCMLYPDVLIVKGFRLLRKILRISEE